MMDATQGWSTQFAVSVEYNIAFGVASEASTGVFITGAIGADCNDYWSGKDCDWFTQAYYLNGTVQWRHVMASTGYSDVGRSIAVDVSSGVVYAGGYSGFPGYITLNKYDIFNGTLIWSNQYDIGQIFDIAVDGNKDIIVTGSTLGDISGM